MISYGAKDNNKTLNYKKKTISFMEKLWIIFGQKIDKKNFKILNKKEI